MKTGLLLKLATVLLISLFTLTARGQDLQPIQLTDAEIPAGYKASPDMLCQSVQAASFYEQTDIYESILGTVKNKAYQSFAAKGDKGTILYLEYEEDFAGEAFLQGMLWGESNKPTKAHPEEYLIRGKYLIIWSFAPNSALKKVSKGKVAQNLK